MFNKYLFFFALALVAVARAVPVCEVEDEESEVQFFPHDSDCTLYYECVHGDLLELPCPDGLYFNPEINVCDYPVNVDCEYEE